MALLIAVGVIGFGGLGGGALAIGLASNQQPAAAPATATPTEEARPSPDAAETPTPVVPPKIRECSVAEAAADPRLAEMQAQVKNATTGEVLFDRGGDTPNRTASALKVITSAAALATLGPDHRATTTVVKGSEPGSVVLVGGGDVTLSRTPSGSETVYPGAAHLDDLAAQVQAAWAADPANPPIQKIILDTDFFGGVEWQPSWNEVERWDGYMPSITALMVDGDRDDPYADVSARSTDPIGRAGQAFAETMGVGVVERGSAPDGAQVLGSVQSPTVAQLIDKSLIVSDNTTAEMLARLVAIEVGTGNSFDAIDAAFKQALAGYRIDLSQVHFADGSGLSDDNSVAPSYFTELFRKVEAREGALGIIFDSLPVAGGPRGSLSYDDRFMGDNAEADGQVFAKTGWIETGYTLAGIIHAADSTPLTFAIYALGDVTDEAKQAIDTLTTAFYRCGDSLSNE
ncbi:D-alanyl-D-alanine carboxypeptidase [Agromyces archimandritae]|uniref:D-alanyl-D-alanine carboxypeptidase n=1 Tax=Agromyces archimandritae TaxID=2781962 RepID=A0A975FQV7_9MICO|nr:D-alanyl-D-alanine carboxypeptidase [Agromyces archimandritae]